VPRPVCAVQSASGAHGTDRIGERGHVAAANICRPGLMRAGRACAWRAVCKSCAMNISQMSKFRRLPSHLPGVRALAASLLCLWLGTGTPAAMPEEAAASESPAAIRVAAEQLIRSQLRGALHTIYVQAAEPDARLHLARCPAALSASLLAGAELSARSEVRVSCTAQRSVWSVYVPVSIESDVNVLVLREGALRGARLTPEQVACETRRLPGLAGGYISNVQALQHYTLARSLPAGTALTAELMLADYVVRQGQQVTLVATAPGISVRAVGRALEDGREGAHVRVQNLASQKVVQGTVDASGTIAVTP
jgi:flagella basal body P-ring formation protein FlgA